MMRNRYHTASLRYDFILWLVILISFIISISTVLRNDKMFSEVLAKKIEYNADKSFIAIKESLQYTEYIVNQMGRLISNNHKDTDYINNILKSFEVDYSDYNLLSWNTVSWTDSYNKLIVNSKMGVLKESIDVSNRDFVLKSISNPGKLYMVSYPMSDALNGEYVIASGVSFFNKDVYIGSIYLSFVVELLLQKINNLLECKYLRFALVSRDFNVISVYPRDIKLDDVVIDNLQMLKVQYNLDNGLISKASLLNYNNPFAYFFNIEGQPYSVVLSFEKDYTKALVIKNVLSVLVDVSIFNALLIIILLFIRSYYIKSIDHLLEYAQSIVVSAKAEIITDELVLSNYINELGIVIRKLDSLKFYIGEEERYIKEYNKKAIEVEYANKVKSDFIACISHELRTPLNTIIAFSEVLKNQMFGPIGNIKYKEYSMDINSAGKKLIAIINDILDLSKIESGIMNICKTKSNINEIVKESIDLFYLEASENKICINYDLSLELPNVDIDVLRTRQAIVNIISNAIKFTFENGKIEILTQYNKVTKSVIVIIEDNGIGMSKDDIEKALKDFEQLDSGLTRKFEGTGLGLSLAKKIIEIQKGVLEVVSEVNKGTKVTVSFPVSDDKRYEDNSDIDLHEI